MAEHIDTTGSEPAEAVADRAPVRRSRTIAQATPAPTTRRAARAARRRHPVRGLAVYGAVGALVATMAIPAFSAARSDAQARTVQQVAADDAQSLVVASAATPEAADLGRSSYAATSPQEIQKKKAEAAAAERARKAAAAAAADAAARTAAASEPVASTRSSAPVYDNAGTGAVRWPLAGVRTLSDYFGARGGEHQGVDFPAPGGTPVYAATAGTVYVSTESYYGYGVAVGIATSMGGQQIKTLYGHMTYGSRTVSVGQHVQAGQMIGRVGNTGHSFGTHLHFELHVNGPAVDPMPWLRANAG